MRFVFTNLKISNFDAYLSTDYNPYFWKISNVENVKWQVILKAL